MWVVVPLTSSSLLSVPSASRLLYSRSRICRACGHKNKRVPDSAIFGRTATGRQLTTYVFHAAYPFYLIIAGVER